MLTATQIADLARLTEQLQQCEQHKLFSWLRTFHCHLLKTKNNSSGHCRNKVKKSISFTKKATIDKIKQTRGLAEELHVLNSSLEA